MADSSNGKQKQIDIILHRFDVVDDKIDSVEEQVNKIHICVALLDNEKLPGRMRALENSKIAADSRSAFVKNIGAVSMKLVAIAVGIPSAVYGILKFAGKC